MKHISAVMFLMFFLFSPASAQMIEDEEPTEKELGAPLYPGAVYTRKTVGIDPFHETSMYITLVPMNIVETFFKKKLPEKRVVYYDDEDIYMTAFLLKTWSKFPGNPFKEELSKLECEPNVQIRYYDSETLEPLAEYFEKKPDGKTKANIIRNGKTMILYTYEKSDENKSSKKIIAAWKEVSRDLAIYTGSILEFRSDGKYTFTFTPGNLDALAKELASSRRFKDKYADEVRKYIEERNPEKGKYVVVKNTITMVSEMPVDGTRTKSGLVDIGRATLSLELINKPRLTFLRTSIE